MAGKHSDGEVLDAVEANGQTGVYATIEAGENITAGNAVYIDPLLATVFVSDTGNVTDTRCDGIATNTATSGNDVTIQKSGIFVTTGFTDKTDVYLSTSGSLSTTVSGVKIGFALSTTELLILIEKHELVLLGRLVMSNATTANFPSLPAHNMYVVKFVLRADDGNGSIGLQFNGDTDANYAYQDLIATTLANTTGATSIRLVSTLQDDTASGMVMIPGTKLTNDALAVSAMIKGKGAGGASVGFGGEWEDASVTQINRINVLDASGNGFTGQVLLYYDPRMD